MWVRSSTGLSGRLLGFHVSSRHPSYPPREARASTIFLRESDDLAWPVGWKSAGGGSAFCRSSMSADLPGHVGAWVGGMEGQGARACPGVARQVTVSVSGKRMS